MRSPNQQSVGHLSYDEVLAAADLDVLIDEIEAARLGLSRARMVIPQRAIVARSDGAAAFASMPCYGEADALFIVKSAAIVSGSGQAGRPLVSATVTAYCGTTGRILAFLDGVAITNLKCAALSAVITRACTAEGPHALAILGSGVQARQQIWGLSRVRRLDEIRIFARRASSVEAFVQWAAQAAPDLCVRSCATLDEAVRDASIISTTTSSSTPLSAFDGLRPGVHFNCMGAHTPASRELPRELLAAAVLIVEDRATALDEAGSAHQDALEVEDLAHAQNLAEQTTVFSSTGHAFYDFTAVLHVLRRLGAI